MKPQLLLDIRNWYIATYKDKFFVHPPAFFTTYAILEAVYHLPLSLWAIGAILRGKSFPAVISLNDRCSAGQWVKRDKSGRLVGLHLTSTHIVC